MIKDPYGRPVTSVRVSITQKCNLNCFYCHHEGETSDLREEMTAEEIERVMRVVSSYGIEKVKLTGGEPLMRDDILEIVHRINGIPGICEVSMTTNGTLLHRFADSLADAGLARVNISLDTLKPQTYRMITGVNALDDVLSGIRGAVNAGLSPVKINMVLLRSVNDCEVWDMIEFSRENGLILQLIELESGEVNDEFYRRYHFDMSIIERELEEKADRIIVRDMHHRRKYLLNGGVEVEVVKPMHNTEFCRYCNRMRITSDGKFKPCLFRSDNLLDFLTPMRRGVPIEDLRRIFEDSVRRREPFFK